MRLAIARRARARCSEREAASARTQRPRLHESRCECRDPRLHASGGGQGSDPSAARRRGPTICRRPDGRRAAPTWPSRSRAAAPPGDIAWAAFARGAAGWRLAGANPNGYKLGLFPVGADLVESQPVYRKNDPNCCPTGGFDHRRFHWNGRALVVVRRWHDAQAHALNHLTASADSRAEYPERNACARSFAACGPRSREESAAARPSTATGTAMPCSRLRRRRRRRPAASAAGDPPLRPASARAGRGDRQDRSSASSCSAS